MTKFMILFVAMVGGAPAFADFSTGGHTRKATCAAHDCLGSTVDDGVRSATPGRWPVARGFKIVTRRCRVRVRRHCRRYGVQAAVTSPRENDER
jgi:hypothetical protein